MNRKFLFLALLVFPVFHACHTEDHTQEAEALKNHLPASLVNNPRTLQDDTSALNSLGNLVFTDTIHDFGKITEGEIMTYDFEFENTGKKDIIISEAKASCGCTVASFPQQPVKSKEKNKIAVTFNSEDKKGYNEKMIIVHTNGNPSIYNLYIRAEVHAK
jgi:hypothetical protein